MVWAPEGHFDRHLPFVLLTGFLGSGKTTLLNWLLRHPRLGDTAVAINEFGAIPLDHNFIEAAAEDVIVLANGCMCCFAGDDLEQSLVRIFKRRDDGALPDFKRLIIETSGLADPEFVLQAVLDSPIGARFLWLDRIVTTVDALYGARQLDEHREALKQVRLADKLVITKSDLVDASQLHALQASLGSINGRAEQLLTNDPALDVDQLFSDLFLEAADRPSLLGAWVSGEARLAGAPSGAGASLADRPASSGHAHAHGPGHAPGARAVALTSDAPVDWRQFHLWLGREQRRLGERLLRVKGIVNVDGSAEPVVIHAVQSTLHVPVSLKAWPDADRRTRMVFILSRGTDDRLQESWDLFLAGMTQGSVRALVPPA